MDTLSVVVLGIAMMFNFTTIYWKFKHNNIANAILDGVILGLIMYLTAGSVAGLSIGTVASALFSIYLVFDPVNGKTLLNKSLDMFDISMGYIMGDGKKRKKHRKKRKKKMLKKKEKELAKKRNNMFNRK